MSASVLCLRHWSILEERSRLPNACSVYFHLPEGSGRTRSPISGALQIYLSSSGRGLIRACSKKLGKTHSLFHFSLTNFISFHSLVATLVAILPPCLILFFNPQKRLLPLGLAACAWGFFMFSFQVHEKSVLLPLVPTTLVLAGSLDKNTVSWVSWMNNVAMFR